jgi:D-serine deaminase-like pyridoxal phosphate-dependent protein
MLTHLETPRLLLDAGRMARNIDRLQTRLRAMGVPLRPHIKTTKSVDVIRATLGGTPGPVTVSTLKEAEYALAHGLPDILYAVGLTPNKLERVTRLRRDGAALTVVVDNRTTAERLAAEARRTGDPIPALIEIDCDGHRAGIRPDDPELIAIGRTLVEGGAELAGVMTHAGGSYQLRGEAARAEAAEAERAAAIRAAERLRQAGWPAPVVSVGSTPTAHAARNLDGVTEVRAGVFVFFDLVMAGIGVCSQDDIALSVLASVVDVAPGRNRIIVDAGWMALSRDRGTAAQPIDQFYGIVCDLDGRPYPDLVVLAANQEHGALGLRPGSGGRLPDLAVGDLVRILPNHACATAAQHDHYVVLDGRDIRANWPRINHW